MSEETIQRLLEGRYPDPDGGGALRVPTRAVVIRESLAGDEAELMRRLDLGRTFAVVSDPVTHDILGSRVERALAALGTVTSLVLPSRPHADETAGALVGRETAHVDALVAVGSGTITDLTKYAAARAGKPCVVFGTAPSMNGYTSPSAAITVDGLKKSVPAVAPVGVFLDLAVLAAAPVRLIRAGLGDSLCRSTAQADWLLAHLLRGEPYRQAPFALLAADEPGLLAESEALVRGDRAVVARLARTLVLSGFGMAICGGSYPASQGEHLISHYADMLGSPAWPPSFHGEQVGVATLAMAALQEEMLRGPAPQIGPTRADESALVQHFGPALGAACWRELARKRLETEAAEGLTQRLAEGWEKIRSRLLSVTRTAGELRAALARAGAPVTPEALGWPRAFFRDAVLHAREIRSRWTFLDLAADARRLEAFAAAL
ncbi:MAG: sn-glycerol-1-phosphate dehydrogenase [Candidatus Rokuibacteriota bacterium]